MFAAHSSISVGYRVIHGQVERGQNGDREVIEGGREDK